MATDRDSVLNKLKSTPTVVESAVTASPDVSPTDGYLYVMPMEDTTGNTSPNLSMGIITKAGGNSPGVVDRKLLYLKDQAFQYGPGYFVPWGSIVALV